MVAQPTSGAHHAKEVVKHGIIMSSVLFGLSVESGRIIINYHAAANSDFRLPINTALLRITRSVTGETR